MFTTVGLFFKAEYSIIDAYFMQIPRGSAFVYQYDIL